MVDRINTLILVTDSSYRGVQTVHHIEEMVKNGAIDSCEMVGVAFNRIQGDNRTLEELQALVGLPVLGIIPYDATVQNFDAEGKPLFDLPDDTPALKAVDKIIDKVFA